MTTQYPYVAQDRYFASAVDRELSCSPGTTPPVSTHGYSTLGKLWLDTSVTPNMLRICAVATASGSYVASEWSAFGPVASGGGPVVDLSPYMPLAGNSTKSGNLTVTGTLSAGATTLASVNSTGGGTIGGVGLSGGLVSSNDAHLAVATIGGATFPGGGSIGAGGGTVTASTFAAIGSNGSLSFYGRDGSANWLWYATGNVARLWSSGDKFTVDTNGTISVSGTIFAGAFSSTSGFFNGSGWTIAGTGGNVNIDNGSSGNLNSINLRASTVSTSYDLHVNNGLYVYGMLGGSVGIRASQAVQSDIGGTAMYCPNGNWVGIECHANVFVNTSDAALKTDITASAIGLDAILQLAPRSFRWAAAPEREQLGLIAQEVEAVLPQAVSIAESELHEPRIGIDYATIATALVGAVKELTARVATLEAK